MKRIIAGMCGALLALPVVAQQQQAGNAASTDTEGTFQALVDACDDVDALMLRARIRLQLPRATEEAAAQAQGMLEEGFATCAGGDVEGGKKQLTDALAIAQASAEEKFKAEEMAETSEVSAQVQTSQQQDEAATDSKPWWKFW